MKIPEGLDFKKQSARRKVRTAIKKGLLKRPNNCSKCGQEDTKTIDGRPIIHAHHHDYDRPLDVEWLCAKCHRAETPYCLKSWERRQLAWQTANQS